MPRNSPRAEVPFEEAVLRGLGNWPAGTALLAAVSGGADSTAMLAALAARKQGWRLFCIHVEHGIRPASESRGDAEAVRRFCAALEVPCKVVSIPPGMVAETAKSRRLGIEGAARLYRHAAWNREADRIGAARILVAHTRDDLLETALMRFLRGAGPAGLAAMPAARGRILRPLLELSRAQVLRYLSERDISFRQDATNDDTAYLRNRIRRCLIPLLDEWFPQWRGAVLAAAQTQALTAAFLAAEAARRVPWTRGTIWSAPREQFFAQDEIIREEALFRALDGFSHGRASPDNPDFQAVSQAQGEEAPVFTRPPKRLNIRRFARGACRAVDLGAPGGKRYDSFRLEDKDGKVIISQTGSGAGEEGFLLLIKEPGRYKLKGILIEASAGGEGFPGDGVSGSCFYGEFPLALRPPAPEDFVHAPGGRLVVHEVLDRARRSGYTGIIGAEDPRGIAALIGIGERGVAVLARREAWGSSSFMVKFSAGRTGGLDV